MRAFIFSYVRLFGEALAACLEQCEDGSEVAACYTADVFLDKVIDFVPDIVLIDVTNKSALLEARAVSYTCPTTPVLALGLLETPEEVIKCAESGLIGYAPVHSSVTELLAIIRRALKGECICDPIITGYLFREVRRRHVHTTAYDSADPLTKRESEILRFVVRGFSNKEIARELSLSVATVKNYLHHVFVKLRVKGRLEVLALYRNDPGLVQQLVRILHMAGLQSRGYRGLRSLSIKRSLALREFALRNEALE